MLNGFTPFPEDFAQRYRQAGYWRGETLANLLRDQARAGGARTALVAGDRRQSYGELDDGADRLAAGLHELGIGQNDRVVVQLPNSVAFATASIALFRLGALPVYALPNHRRTEVSYLAAAAEAVAYIAPDFHHHTDHRELAEEVRRAVPSLAHVLIDGDPGPFTALAEVTTQPREFPAPVPADVAFFLLSGGTTGMPKLIPRTHDDYSYQLRATAQALGVDHNGVYLAAQPVAHNACLGCPGLLGTLWAGGKVVLADHASPDESFPLIEREGVTLTTLMPPIVQLWLEAAEFFGVDLSRLVIQVGSAHFAPEVAARVRSELGARLTHWFGMAEGLLTYTRLDDPEDVIVHTQGRPLCPADEIRVVDDAGLDVRAGEVGELLTRGPYTLRGYYDAAEHDAAAFTPDGFLRTGDLVRFTAEGNMVVEGRIKDMINRGGEKVSAGEIEDVLITHPSLRQVAVVAMPDALLGEKTCAFVVPEREAPKLTELRDLLTDHGLADYKLPDRIEVVESFPLTTFGKVNKAELRRLIAAKVT